MLWRLRAQNVGRAASCGVIVHHDEKPARDFRYDEAAEIVCCQCGPCGQTQTMRRRERGLNALADGNLLIEIMQSHRAAYQFADDAAQAEDDDSNHLTESVGNAAAQEAARVGGRIVDRELSVRPTLRIRAGAPVRVLVSQDIVLRPYRR